MKKIKIKKIEIKKTKKVLKRIPLFIAKHAIEFFILLLLIALVLGANVFYKYNVLAIKLGLKDINNSCPLNESKYNKILETWEKHDKMFEESDSKYYHNVFSGEVID